MQRHLVAALWFVMLMLPLNSSADEALDKARELLEKNDPVAAFAVLDPLAESREGEPDFDYLFGIAALDAGYLTHAVFALERVLAVQPDNDVARAEIARAYFLLGERETAMQEFDTVRASGTAPAEAQETIDRYLALLERAPRQAGDETTLIRGWFDITGGYDTNINSGTDQSQIALPALGNVRFQLVDGATEQGSGFVQFAGNVNISHPLTDNIRAIAVHEASSAKLNHRSALAMLTPTQVSPASMANTALPSLATTKTTHWMAIHCATSMVDLASGHTH